MTARLPFPSIKLPGPSQPRLSTRQSPSRLLPARLNSVHHLCSSQPTAHLHPRQNIPPSPSCPIISHKRVASLRPPSHAHPQLRSSVYAREVHAPRVQPQKVRPPKRRSLFSVAYTLFSIHNLAHLFSFVHAAHSLPKTPGGRGPLLHPLFRATVPPCERRTLSRRYTVPTL
jgi:hypothetical protein